MERDSVTGKFMPGNKIAKGNSGNRKPKWRNRNAVKHGYDAKYKKCWLVSDGNLCVEMGKSRTSMDIVSFEPGLYDVDSNGQITLKGWSSNLFGYGSELVFQFEEWPCAKI